MSTTAEKLEAIKHAVTVAENRLKELDSKPTLTRAEQFEKEMTKDCIKRGKILENDLEAL